MVSKNPPISAPHTLFLADRCEHTAELHEERLGGDFFVSVTPLYNADSAFVGSVHVAHDITERKKTEEALQKSEKKYRQLVENLREGIWVIDKDAYTTFVNPAMAMMLGYTVEEMEGKHLFEFMDEEGVKIARHKLENRKQGIQEQHDFEFLRKDGSRVYTSLETSPITDEAGNYNGALAGVMNISERVQAEERLKAALAEKEVLLKEIHHRVKNNLQVISSLLYLQSQYVQDQKSFEIMEESQHRIRSMVLVHEQLYQSRDLSRIHFGEYIRKLVTDLFRSYGVNWDVVSLKIDVEDILLGIDMAIPCGLIVHELVSNSLKHAFPGEAGGEIGIGLHTDDKQLLLRVFDNGVGLPEDLDFRNTDSMGLQLVRTLTRQLEGTIKLFSSGGTEFSITFALTPQQ